MSTTPIRVLQIMGIVENGGVEAVIMNYYRHIDKAKVQFDFVMHKGSNPNYIAEAQSMGAKVYEVTPYTQNVIKFTYDIYRVIKEGNYQIVHSNMNSLSGFSLLAAYFARAKVRILHNHTTDTKEEGFRTTVKRVLRPFAKFFSNQNWACSKLAGEWMYGKEAVKNNQVTIINNAIDLEKFSFNQEKRDVLRKELGLEDKFVVGHVGRFVQTKNHTFIIDVFEEVFKQKKDTVLLLVGEGPLMNSVKDKVNYLGIHQHVFFLGARNDVADLYNVMDVFILPSLYEGLPVVGVECQANGLHFLCSNKVTEEVVLGNTIKLLDLDIGVKNWAEEIIKVAHYSRLCTKEDLAIAGFDISLECSSLEEIYMELDKEKVNV